MNLSVKQRSVIGLISILIVGGGVGFGVSQSLIQKMFTGSVTISAQGDIELLDIEGATLTTVSYGTLAPTEETSVTIKIVNTGNTVVDVSGNRVDQNTEITVEYRNEDGTAFSGSSLKNLAPNDQVVVVIAIWSSPMALGTFQIEILFEAVTVTI